MDLVDTHAHLEDEQLRPQLAKVLSNAREAGVVAMIAVGTTLATSEACVELAERNDPLYASVGIHPNYGGQAADGDWDRVVELSRKPKVVALGETGLDRYWDDCPLEIQQDLFDRHIRLSQSSGLPFIVHMRNCQDDVLEMLREAHRRGPLRGVMHSYTGDLSGALECLALGMHISFAGMVTYKKSDDLRAVAAAIPADRILIETDAPYLSPHPHRSVRPNEPALIRHTAQCLAEVRGTTLAELARQTRRNAQDLFGIA